MKCLLELNCVCPVPFNSARAFVALGSRWWKVPNTYTIKGLLRKVPDANNCESANKRERISCGALFYNVRHVTPLLLLIGETGSPVPYENFYTLSLFLGAGVSSRLVSSAFFWSAPLSRNLSFISFFSSERIKLGFLYFLPRRSRISRKITFTYLYFLKNFIDIWPCANPMRRTPFFPLWRKSQHR